MLTELKRCNSIGNLAGILFLLSIIEGKDKIDKDEIRNRCSLENNIKLNCPGAIAFFEYLKLVSTNQNEVIPTKDLNELAKQEPTEIIKQLVAMSIHNLVEDGIFDNEGTFFDVEKERISIKSSVFPLPYAAIRNFITAAGVFENGILGEIYISKDYESSYIEQLRNHRNKLTLEKLLEQQEAQHKRGLEAEEFVLSLEKRRLPKLAKKIKRISDFDVSAGYDIVSYENNKSNHFDRFIEVKCYIGSPHFFWSENEVDVAKIKANKYILCLVDYSKLSNPNYIPEYIRNPYSVIFNNADWFINTSSYRVQKI